MSEMFSLTARKSGSQQVKQDRDEAIKQMDKWTSAYKKIAHIALEDTPELLEKLGIKYPS